MTQIFQKYFNSIKAQIFKNPYSIHCDSKSNENIQLRMCRLSIGRGFTDACVFVHSQRRRHIVCDTNTRATFYPSPYTQSQCMYRHQCYTSPFRYVRDGNYDQINALLRLSGENIPL